MGDLFRIHFRVPGKIPGQNQVPAGGGDDAVEIFFVDIVEIVVNDVFHRQGKTFENIQVLGKGKPPDIEGMA